MSKKIRCKGCKFFGDELSDGYGQCRRHAPVVVSGDDERVRTSMWPAAHSDDWCGEYQAKAKA